MLPIAEAVSHFHADDSRRGVAGFKRAQVPVVHRREDPERLAELRPGRGLRSVVEQRPGRGGGQCDDGEGDAHRAGHARRALANSQSKL